MGFDNECILNIQTLAGEYFCPVCRLLVIPHEALQSQCTHLYCKPCLAYIANSTKACPYDGYLVTEAESKPLVESNKTLAETINKIAVHCLYHRSGCTWQGPLSECVTHCSGCAFGSSPVVCNRCGTQIVHRQVQEHAQACPGVQPQAQQAGVSQDASATAKAVSDQSHNANQAGVPSTQVQNAQTAAAAAPAQDPNQQASAGIQAQAVSQAAVTTSEQWYQQQYSQYYQQYPGYYPYQQQYQQYYPYQQQAVLQPQQYPQAQAQPQSQLQPQPQSQPQPQPQPQPQVQPQSQPQPQPQVQPQSQSQPQLQPQTLPPTQVQAQHVHAVSVPQAENAQQQVPPVAHMQSQNPPSQAAFYPQAQSQAMPQQYPVQSVSQQHMQTQYQQPQVQMQYQNLQNQPQGYLQLQSQPNPNLQTQAQPAAQPQIQASHPQGQQHLPPPPPVANQAAAQPHVQTNHAVTGYHSYPQAPASQQIQLGAPQQNPVNIRSQQLSQQPMQMQGQFSQSSSLVRPQHALIPNQQQPGLVPAPAQGPNVPATQLQQPMFPYNQQPGNLAQQRPLVPPIQPAMSQQYGQQHQPPPSHQSGPPQSQTYSLTPFGQQQIPMQPQVRSQGPAQPSQPQQAAYPRPQHSVMGSFGSHPSHQSQNLVGRPMMSNQGVLSQAGSIAVKPMQPGYSQNNLISSGGQILGTSSEQRPDVISHTGRAVSDQQVDAPIRKIENMDVSFPAGTGTVETKDAKSHNGSHMGEDKSIEANRSMGKEASSMQEPTDGRLVEAVARDEKFGSTFSPKGQEQQAAAPKDKVDGSSDRILLVQETELSKGHAGNSEKFIQEKGQQDRNLRHVPSNSFGQGVDNSRGFPPHGQLHAGGMIQSSHPDALIDQGRHQPPMLQYGQSPHQQRPPAPMLQATPPGPQYGSPGLGQLPPGMRSPPNQFQQPAFHKPPGAETFPGIMPGNSLPTSYGRGQGPQSIPPRGPHIAGHLLSSRKSQDEMAPGVVDESSRMMMGVKPLHGPEGELFSKRSFYVDDRRPDSHPLNSVGGGLLGRPSGMHLDMVSMHRPPGMDPSSTFNHPDERLKSLQNERVEPLLMESSRNIRERRGFEEDMKHFGRPHDMDPDPFHRSGKFFPSGSPFDRHPLDKPFHPAGPEGGPGSAAASSRSFPPHSHGNLFGETTFGFSEEDRGRFDSSRMHGPGRARMDNLSSRSPGRDYPSFPSRGFGGFGNDIERREQHIPGDPAHFRRGEFEGPGHMRMGDHLRNDDLISRDFAPKNIRRGELLGPRDLPSHMQMREHGGLHGPAHIGESFGPDSFGVNSHSRFGDSRFRSSFYPGDLELAENLRKRKVASMGWCRICNVDCETVEGLDLHSQTREHQKMAMDMVLSIKQQNSKKQKVNSSGKTSVADASKSRTVGVEARGNKK